MTILKADYAMGIFQPDFYRYFAFGFAGGAFLVVAAMGLGNLSPLSDDLMPPAEAAQEH